MTIQKLGTLVFDTIGELCHRGETRLDPDSAEAIELRKMAYRAVGVKTDGDPHWYRAGNSATRCWNGSRALETSAVFKPHPRRTRRTESAEETPSLNGGCNSGSCRTR
jgi:hypothetical protein